MRFSSPCNARKGLILVILACLAASMSACVDENRIHELEAQNAELQDRVRELEIGIETLNADFQAVDSSMVEAQAAADDLEGNVSRFDSENWREVVLDVTSDSSNVINALENLRTNLERLDHHLDDVQ